MTSHAFTTTFDSALHNGVIKKSIDRTSNAAEKFIKKTLQKMVKNCGSQSMSIDELFVDYNN